VSVTHRKTDHTRATHIARVGSATMRIGETPLVEQLQQHIADTLRMFGMSQSQTSACTITHTHNTQTTHNVCLLDLIEQHQRERASSQMLGQQTSLRNKSDDTHTHTHTHMHAIATPSRIRRIPAAHQSVAPPSVLRGTRSCRCEESCLSTCRTSDLWACEIATTRHVSETNLRVSWRAASCLH
jgi:hypothetical protein